jgi:hypothetical protein
VEVYSSAKADESSFSMPHMGHQQQVLACLAAICGFLLLACMGGCAGTSASSTSPSSQQAPQISASQTSVNVLTGGTANVTLTVSGTPTSSIGCTVSGAGTEQLSGLVMTYTAPNIVPAGGEATIGCTASNAAGSATASVIAHILASSTPPQISASQTSVNVLTGGTANVTLTVSGTPTPSVGCTVSGAGTAQLSGLVMTYTAPNIVPAGGEATIGCTASNAAGSATASVIANIFTVIPGYSGSVPSTFFGMHIMQPYDWPTVSFGALGKGSGIGFANIEPAKGQFNWSRLDEYVDAAQANGVEIFYSGGGVPPWAAADQSTCQSGPYGTSCTSTVANIQDLDNFMTALVTRYKGRIEIYELYNEPQNSFSGTMAELVAYTQTEHDAIRSIDSAATILSPSTVSYGDAYLDTYFAAGGTKDIDAVAMHAYPDPNNDIAEVITGSLTTEIRAVMAKYGLSTKPLWDTESSWGYASKGAITDPEQQAAFVGRAYLLHWSMGITRAYWYGWDSTNIGTMWSSTAGVSEAGIAYGQVYNWMNGATMTQPCSIVEGQNGYNGVYICDLTRSNGSQASAVWNTVGSSTYTAPSQYLQYRTLQGNVYNIAGDHQVIIGQQPILLEGTVTVDKLVLASLTPSSKTAGGAGFTLTINGSGFVDGAIVSLNGSGRYRTFVNSTQMTAAILARDIAKAGTTKVTVTNPAPGENHVYSGCKCTTSNYLTFTIDP